MAIHLTVNGDECVFQGDPLTPLVDVLRDSLLLTGAKAVCREGFCGACTVHVDGQAVVSCLKPVGVLTGKSVVTIEGLATYDDLTPLQRSLETHDAVQCGMCFPGMVMSLSAFVEANPSPTRSEIKSAMAGNACRCTGYERIVDAVYALGNLEKDEHHEK